MPHHLDAREGPDEVLNESLETGVLLGREVIFSPVIFIDSADQADTYTAFVPAGATVPDMSASLIERTASTASSLALNQAIAADNVVIPIPQPALGSVPAVDVGSANVLARFCSRTMNYQMINLSHVLIRAFSRAARRTGQGGSSSHSRGINLSA